MLWVSKVTKTDKVEVLNIRLEQWWNGGDKGKSKCLEEHLYNTAINNISDSLAYGLC